MSYLFHTVSLILGLVALAQPANAEEQREVLSTFKDCDVCPETDQANFNGNYTYNGSNKGMYRQQTMPVGSFSANAFGLHDVHGNVYEYVEDCRHESYAGGPVDGSPWTGTDCRRLALRGGSWKARPPFNRSAMRNRVGVNYRRASYGFRVARDVDS
jgi:formylglycine-generating enzyme required for sulfatase activity